jgi:hypothetical protein
MSLLKLSSNLAAATALLVEEQTHGRKTKTGESNFNLFVLWSQSLPYYLSAGLEVPGEKRGRGW